MIHEDFVYELQRLDDDVYQLEICGSRKLNSTIEDYDLYLNELKEYFKIASSDVLGIHSMGVVIQLSPEGQLSVILVFPHHGEMELYDLPDTCRYMSECLIDIIFSNK